MTHPATLSTSALAPPLSGHDHAHPSRVRCFSLPAPILRAVFAATLGLLVFSTAGTSMAAEPAEPDDEVDILDARSCPEIFGDEEIVAANKKRRTGRFHGVKRGPSDVTVTHQVAWWTVPKRLRIPEALVVDVLSEDDVAEDEIDANPSATDKPPLADSPPTADSSAADSTASDATATDVVASGDGPSTPPATAEGDTEAAVEVKPSLHEEEKKAALAGAGLVVRHGSISSPLPPPGKPEPELAVAHVELGDSYKELCTPGIYEVNVDDSVGQDARIYALLDEGVLIEAGDTLAFLTLDDGPAVPTVRMIWRSAYAIAFEDAAAKSKVKKKSKKKKPKKKKRKSRRSRKR